MHVELGEQASQKELAGGQERNRLHRATRNGKWLSAVTHLLNGTEMSQEEFQENLCISSGLVQNKTDSNNVVVAYIIFKE